ncbi:hypothetical protein ACIQF6_25095 [Kitasatospora sp. NPDC092948]|uniref:hypothetical protein n=1 Tax=Kitasatospora sp. NPDC092948 TaxID=3364088 RepID=UPI0037FB9136
MTKTVPVRGHYRNDGSYVRPHHRTIKSANSATCNTGYTTYRSGSGNGGKAAAGGGGLLLVLLFLIGITSSHGNSATTGPSPAPSITRQVGVNP